MPSRDKATGAKSSSSDHWSGSSVRSTREVTEVAVVAVDVAAAAMVDALEGTEVCCDGGMDVVDACNRGKSVELNWNCG